MGEAVRPSGERSGDGESTLADTRQQRLQLWFVLLVGIAFACGVLAHVDALSGPAYWKWPWRNLGLARTLGMLAPPLALFLVGWPLVAREPVSRGRALAALAVLVTTNFSLQVLGILCHPHGLDFLKAIVQSPVATSYFSDAQTITHVTAWLRDFHLAHLGLHSATHPPGPILYYYVWLKWLGPSTGALAGGLALGAIASLGVPVMYAFARLWTPDRRMRLFACAMYALLPALIVFLPEFDQIYPILAMLIVLTWVQALQGSMRCATLLGVTLFVATFFAYNLLATGAFLALHGGYFLWRQRADPHALHRLIRVALVALAVPTALYLALWFFTGFDPLRSFTHAVHAQNELPAMRYRSWLDGLLFAPYDFFLGSGMLVVPLLLLFARKLVSEFDWERSDQVLSLIALGTILIVDLSGLLRAETARVWLFLQPFAVVPAASELIRLGRGRVAVFVLQWFITAVLLCNMIFINA